ncbi:RecX family transcriptional regulator [Candidatus Saccharibacteria bacterium]|nr:RecX family transcriptional regulator [Candidatus Saccharibacteria bacterium]
MEIFSLKDEGSSREKASENSALTEAEALKVDGFKITALKQGVKNPNRVNVFINGKFELSLDVAQVVDYKLKVGRVLSEDELAELRRASEFGKLYQRTLEWVLIRPRSEKEVRDYLFRKSRNISRGHFATNGERVSEVSPVTTGRDERVRGEVSGLSDKVLERLSVRGYLDDRAFAKYYVENRFVKKGISKKRLRMELMKKGVSREIIDEVLDARDDKEELLKMINKKRAKYDDEKLIEYLVRQGFPYDLVKETVQECKETSD